MANAFQANAFQINAFQIELSPGSTNFSEIGSGVSGGRFTEKGWRPIRPYALKWSKKRHDRFIEELRTEAVGENKLSAVQRAERELERGKTYQELKDAEDRLNEAKSREYIEGLWSEWTKSN